MKSFYINKAVFVSLSITISLFVGSGVAMGEDAMLPPDKQQGSLTNVENRHNMSSKSAGAIRAKDDDTGTDQICIFCHTPHSAAKTGPLWSRPDPAGPASGFQLYAQPLAIKGDTIPAPTGTGLVAPDAPGGPQNRSKYTTDTTINPDGYPNGSSRLCLSCHDGATAVSILNDGTTIAMVGAEYLSGQSQVDLSTAHPISFVYNGSVLNDILIARGADTYALPVPEINGVDGDNIDTPLDSKDRMQCTTCHDPHYDTSLAVGKESLPPFWRQTSGATPYDDVCNVCHKTPPSRMTDVHPIHPPL